MRYSVVGQLEKLKLLHMREHIARDDLKSIVSKIQLVKLVEAWEESWFKFVQSILFQTEPFQAGQTHETVGRKNAQMVAR